MRQDLFQAISFFCDEGFLSEEMPVHRPVGFATVFAVLLNLWLCQQDCADLYAKRGNACQEDR